MGTIEGQLDGKRLSAVDVHLSGPTTRSSITDARGAFAFDGLEPGTYELAFEHLGYQRRVDTVRVAPGRGALVTGSLAPESFELDELRVRVKPTGWIRELMALEDRMSVGDGTLLTREDIVTRFTARGGINTLLRGIPGVHEKRGRLTLPRQAV